jgi:hypothetical protein
MFQLLLYVFVTYSTIIIALIASHNVIVILYFKGPRVRAGICISDNKNTLGLGKRMLVHTVPSIICL